MKLILNLILLILIVVVVNCKPNCNSYSNYPSIKIDASVYTSGVTNGVYVLIQPGQNSYLMVSQSVATNVTVNNTLVEAIFLDDIETTGWGKLNVTSFAASSTGNDDCLQMYAGGFVEGVLTAQRIYQMYTNFAAAEFKNHSQPSSTLLSYMNQQLSWVRKGVIQDRKLQQEEEEEEYFEMQIEDELFTSNSTVYWYSIKLLMSQFDGLVAGYAQSQFATSNPMTEMQLYLLSSAGDLQTLNTLYGDPHPSSKSGKIKEHMLNNFQDMKNSEDDIDFLDCSALIRLLPDNQDLLFAHTTWRYYYGMLRIYKFYNFDIQAYNLAFGVSFSSSPGFLSSKDDFYITKNGLAVMETTNSIYNETLYSFVMPETLLVWQRAIISNIIAQNAPTWMLVFQQYNSGTYNNQWMVIDYKLFSQGDSLPPNTFWILEQIPGYCEMQDVTPILNKMGFWPSYNVPYFEYIYNVSGYPQMYESYGNSYSYTQCPRALIFNRNATNIMNYAEMQEIMQYNYYEHDPLSLGSPSNSISARADLLLTKPVPFGGVDSKVTSSSEVPTLSCTAISGPTHQGLPPFTWSSNPLFNSTIHIGLPDTWAFDWQNF